MLTLCEKRPLDRITVGQVAEEAGVNRSTFYQHATSVPDLLRSVLTEELDTIRDRHLSDVEYEHINEAVTATTIDVMNHAISHRHLYRETLGRDGDAALHSVLSNHFRGTIEMLIAERMIDPQAEVQASDAPLFTAMTAHFVAHGAVGAIEAWLASDEQDVEQFMVLYGKLVPSWWPIARSSSE